MPTLQEVIDALNDYVFRDEAKKLDRSDIKFIKDPNPCTIEDLKTPNRTIKKTGKKLKGDFTCAKARS